MKRFPRGWALAAARSAFALGTPPAIAATPSDQLVIGTSLVQVLSLDPQQGTEAKALEVMANLYDRLVAADVEQDNALVPSSSKAGRWTMRASPSRCATRASPPAIR